MEKLKPKLFSVMKTYSKEQFVKDVIAGIIVAIIALPLSIALALASGVNPERGLYTAIVAGFIIAFLGGSRVQISGPTAAFATIVAGIVASDGIEGLAVATIMAGIFLILMGVLRLGGLIRFIPYTITTGFTAGIAVTIAIGQVKDFLGLQYEPGVSPIETVDKVKEADVIIFAGGISPAVEGEEMHVNIPGFKGGDRETIELPSIQSRLLAELKKAGKKIVFVNFSGSAIALTPESKTCDAILQAWYPGQAGGTAIANVLFGDYNPAGRLPVTFYKSTKQLPDFEDYSMKGRTYRYMTENPLFPFGHGLSYTTFQYGNASLNTSEIKDGEQVTLTIPVSNTGKYDGEEVVQVYLRHPGDKEGPSHALRAFKRVAIAKGATNNVTIPLSKENFEWFDTSTNTMRPIEGDYEILYGGTSELKQLKSIPVTIK